MITHEMNMALYATDKMIVLFKGRIVEYGDTKKILKDPLHPYTQLMIEALPRIDKNIERKILQKTLDAQKKGLTESVRGCRFAYRCPFATERCFNEDPVLEEIDKDHYVACWLHNRR
jgi:peptide/nickel transport system ATP-binding protein